MIILYEKENKIFARALILRIFPLFFLSSSLTQCQLQLLGPFRQTRFFTELAGKVQEVNRNFSGISGKLVVFPSLPERLEKLRLTQCRFVGTYCIPWICTMIAPNTPSWNSTDSSFMTRWKQRFVHYFISYMHPFFVVFFYSDYAEIIPFLLALFSGEFVFWPICIQTKWTNVCLLQTPCG